MGFISGRALGWSRSKGTLDVYKVIQKFLCTCKNTSICLMVNLLTVKINYNCWPRSYSHMTHTHKLHAPSKECAQELLNHSVYKRNNNFAGYISAQDSTLT
jgi:hypothetical protein